MEAPATGFDPLTRFASASSRHPIPALAIGEVIGQIFETLGGALSFAALFVSAGHTGALDDIVETVHATLSPGALIGATATGVVSTGEQVENAPAIALWAGRSANEASPARTVLLDTVESSHGTSVRGWDDDEDEDVGSGRWGGLILLADPLSFAARPVLKALRQGNPALPLVGGYASAGRRAGGNRLIRDHDVVSSGAVGLLLPAGVVTSVVVSQGHRAVGPVLTVTAVDGKTVQELALEPALDRFDQVVDACTDEERDLMADGLRVAVWSGATGDPVGRRSSQAIVGVDRDRRALLLGEAIGIGDRVQFTVHDGRVASRDLGAALDAVRSERGPASALVFTARRQGRRLSRGNHHDARTIDDALAIPAAGMFAAQVFGTSDREEDAPGEPWLHDDAVAVSVMTAQDGPGAYQS